MALIQFIFLAPLPLSKRTGVSTRKLRVSDTRCVCSAIIINWIKVIYWIPEKSAAITWPHTLTYKVSAMVLRQGNKWLGGCHLLNSSNLAENFETRGFWVRRYVALVVSAPIPLRTQRAKAAQEVRGTSVLRGPKWNVDPRDTKLFCLITETITRTPHLIYHPRYINLNKLLKPFDDVFFVCRI